MYQRYKKQFNVSVRTRQAFYIICEAEGNIDGVRARAMRGGEEEEWKQKQDLGLVDIYGQGPVILFAHLEYAGCLTSTFPLCQRKIQVLCSLSHGGHDRR